MILPLLLGFAHAQTPFFEDLGNFRERSLTIRTERANLEAADDVLLSRRMFWTPSLGASLNRVKTRVNGDDLPTTDDVTADLRWNLFRGGGDWHELGEAGARRRAQELQVLNETLAVEVRAADVIFRSIYLAEISRLQENFSKLKEETLRIARDRYAQGKLPLHEISKAEVDLIQQRGRARLARLDQAENRAQAATLFVTEIATVRWPFAERTEPRVSGKESSPLVERRALLRDSFEERWRATRAGHWPSLDFSLQYKQWPLSSREQNQWLGVFSLTLPIWSRYETSAASSSAYSAYLGAGHEFQSTEREVSEKAVFLREKIAVARANLQEAKGNLTASQTLYRDMLRSFRLGRLSTNDLLLEQNRLFDSETALAVSQLSFHQTLIEICSLAGRKASECLD